MAITPLKEVSSNHSRWRVKVRAVRLYRQFNNEKPPKLTKFEFIMLDEENTAMEAFIPFKWIENHKDKLMDGKVYILQYLEIVNAKATHRAVAHVYMARLTNHTQICEVSPVPETFPLYAYSITPLAALHQKVDRTDHMSDVIGIFTKCSRITRQSTRNGVQSLINVHISDTRDTVVLALWGPHAESFNAETLMELGKQCPVVLLFVGVTVKIFNGDLALQCSKTCSWYVNPAIPEATLLRQSCGSTIEQPHWLGEDNSPPENTSVAHLASSSNPHEVLGNRYIVTARIKSLLPNEPWWYRACTACKCKARPYGDVYRCTNPKCNCQSAIARFRLAFLAEDPETPAAGEKEMIELICFSPIADELTGIPPQIFTQAVSNGEDYIPDQITGLYGKKYEFHLSVPQGALQRIRTGFKIDSFTRIVEAEDQGFLPVPVAAVDDKTSPSVPVTTAVQPVALPEQENSAVTPALNQNTMAALPDLEVDTNSMAQENASTPIKAILDNTFGDVTTVTAHGKTKDISSRSNADMSGLEDSDCETRMPEHKKPRAARKLSMPADDIEE